MVVPRSMDTAPSKSPAPSSVAPERTPAFNGPTPGALQGDDYALEYHPGRLPGPARVSR